MKSIFYIGATLMIGAGIYGFVDYKKTSHNREFNSLYQEKETTASKEVSEEAPVLIKETPVMKTAGSATVLPAKEEVQPIARTATKRSSVKKKKKLNYKSFSRARIEEFEPPKVVSDETNTEVTTEKKEQ
jgi:hypothetical protein